MKIYLQGAMQWLPFFILPLLFSCSPNRQPEKPAVPQTAGPVLYDTAIAPYTYDRTADSIRDARERDSFYAIPPLYTFTDKGDSLAEDRVIARFMHSSLLRAVPVSFTETIGHRYDKDQMPVNETRTYTGGGFTVKIVNDDLEGGVEKKLFINGKRLRPGKDIDTSLVSAGFLEMLELHPDQFRILEYGNRKLLYLRGGMEKCNGTGCGVSYHLLYDIRLHKAVAVEHYRVTDFYIGDIPGTNDFSFLKFSDISYNQLLNNINYSARMYAFTVKGKLNPVTGREQQPCYFSGYAGNDSMHNIVIQEAVFPAYNEK